MIRRRPIRLSILLAGIPVLAIVPLLVFAGVLLHMTWSSHQREMRHDVEQAVQALAAAVDGELGATVRRLETIAELPVLAVGRLDEFHWQMQQVLAVSPDWLDIALIDEEGSRLVGAAAPFEMTVERPAPPRRHPVFDSGRATVTDLEADRPGGAQTAAVSVPVRRDGRIRWVLTARLDPRAFTDMLARQQVRTGDARTVFDRNLRVVARSRDGDAFVGRSAAGIYTDAGSGAGASKDKDAGAAGAGTTSSVGTTGANAGVDTSEGADTGAGAGIGAGAGAATSIVRAGDLDGVESILGWRRLPSGWTVGVAAPTRAYDMPLRRSMLGLSLAGLFTLGLALVSSVALGRRIGVAVEAASDDARLLLEENLVPPVRPSGIRQFDALSHSLHDTGERLSMLLRSERQSRLSAEAANRSKDEFLAMLGHELRNPMSAITNASKLLRRADLSGPQREQMSAVLERQNAHMKRLVDDLLDVGRVLSGKIVITRERVDLAEVVERAVTTMRVAGRLAGHQVKLSLAPVFVRGDAVRLEQVATNLVGNAARYSGSGGLIEVTVARDARGAILQVRDDGIGMTPEMLARAFELFAQGDQELHREQGGLGIGLTLTRRLLEMHGGSISATSDGPDQGSTFTVRLPLDVARPVREAVLAEAA